MVAWGDGNDHFIKVLALWVESLDKCKLNTLSMYFPALEIVLYFLIYLIAIRYDYHTRKHEKQNLNMTQSILTDWNDELNFTGSNFM